MSNDLLTDKRLMSGEGEAVLAGLHVMLLNFAAWGVGGGGSTL